MKTLKKILLITALSLTLGAQTQFEMNQQACAGLTRAQTALDKVYKRILAANANDANFVSAFTAAQKAWLAFRDAHMQALYPDPTPNAYGSVNPMCRCTMLEILTRERAKQLRDLWVLGTIEGDVCGGSLPVRQEKAAPGKHKAAP